MSLSQASPFCFSPTCALLSPSQFLFSHSESYGGVYIRGVVARFARKMPEQDVTAAAASPHQMLDCPTRAIDITIVGNGTFTPEDGSRWDVAKTYVLQACTCKKSQANLSHNHNTASCSPPPAVWLPRLQHLGRPLAHPPAPGLGVRHLPGGAAPGPRRLQAHCAPHAPHAGPGGRALYWTRQPHLPGRPNSSHNLDIPTF